MLINIQISGDRNVIKKKPEKSLKYKDFTIEIQVDSMCNVKTNATPVITGATLTISTSFRKYLNNIPAKARNQGTTENSNNVALHKYFGKY
jgi:hypothetical protein